MGIHAQTAYPRRLEKERPRKTKKIKHPNIHEAKTKRALKLIKTYDIEDDMHMDDFGEIRGMVSLSFSYYVPRQTID